MKTPKILLIDSNKKILSLTSHHLRKAEFRVLTAQSTLEVHQILNCIKVDLILLDTSLNTESIYSLVKSIKKRTSAPFIFITARSLTQDRIKGYQLGCISYISKPFDLDELIAIINNVFCKQETRLTAIKSIVNKIKKISFKVLNANNSHIVMNKLYFTYREKSVIQFLLNGLSNKEISNKIGTSVRNVEKYVSRLLNKTKTKTRSQLVKYIYSTPFL